MKYCRKRIQLIKISGQGGVRIPVHDPARPGGRAGRRAGYDRLPLAAGYIGDLSRARLGALGPLIEVDGPWQAVASMESRPRGMRRCRIRKECLL